MDLNRFDRLAVSLSVAATRRGAVAGLLGGIVAARLLAHDPDDARAVRRKGKKKGKRRRRRTRAAQSRAIPPTPLVPVSGGCFTGTNCLIGPGVVSVGCNFGGSTAFAEQSLEGAVLSGANLSGVNASGANFQGALLDGACLVGANLLGAMLDTSTIVEGAIFCNTVMPDGSVNNTGCGLATPCCPTTTATCPGGACGSGDCRILFQSCGVFAGTCCNEPTATCTESRVGVAHCQVPCSSDAQCENYWPGADLICFAATVCQFLPDDKRCCQPKTCSSNQDCPKTGKCCTQSIFNTKFCCLPIQKCGILGCEY